jgi:predicted RNA-binding Zn ribbon-like protein
MSSSPPSRSFAPQLPLKFVGGDVSLDFINTVDWTPGGLDNDRLPDYGRLITWARTARVITDAEAQALRLASAHRPAAAQAAYEMARLTRWILHQLFYAVATRQRQLLESTLPEYNQLLSRAYQRLQVSPATPGRRAGAPLSWRWQVTSEELDILLWPVVRAAADLLTSPEAARIRVCAGPDCGWLYVDRSRNGLRRWCEMRTCGTLAKSRRRAARRRRRRHARNTPSRTISVFRQKS